MQNRQGLTEKRLAKAGWKTNPDHQGRKLTRQPAFERTGRCRETISNGRIKADSGRKEECHRTSPPGTNRDIGQGSRMEAVGNNSEKMVTGSENFARLLVLFLETGIVGKPIARSDERRYTECRKRSYQSSRFIGKPDRKKPRNYQQW